MHVGYKDSYIDGTDGFVPSVLNSNWGTRMLGAYWKVFVTCLVFALLCLVLFAVFDPGFSLILILSVLAAFYMFHRSEDPVKALGMFAACFLVGVFFHWVFHSLSAVDIKSTTVVALDSAIDERWSMKEVLNWQSQNHMKDLRGPFSVHRVTGAMLLGMEAHNLMDKPFYASLREARVITEGILKGQELHNQRVYFNIPTQKIPSFEKPLVMKERLKYTKQQFQTIWDRRRNKQDSDEQLDDERPYASS